MGKSISEQRAEWWNVLKGLQAEKDMKREEIAKQDESIPGGMTDEEWDSKMDELDAEYDEKITQASRRYFWLQYKASRNEWFKGFVESFGICESRRISKKQGEIFKKYSEWNHDRETGRGTTYFVRVNNLCVKTTCFTEHEPCYVTIIKF